MDYLRFWTATIHQWVSHARVAFLLTCLNASSLVFVSSLIVLGRYHSCLKLITPCDKLVWIDAPQWDAECMYVLWGRPFNSSNNGLFAMPVLILVSLLEASLAIYPYIHIYKVVCTLTLYPLCSPLVVLWTKPSLKLWPPLCQQLVLWFLRARFSTVLMLILIVWLIFLDSLAPFVNFCWLMSEITVLHMSF